MLPLVVGSELTVSTGRSGPRIQKLFALELGFIISLIRQVLIINSSKEVRPNYTDLCFADLAKVICQLNRLCEHSFAARCQ